MKQYDPDFLECFEKISFIFPAPSEKEIQRTYRQIMKTVSLKKRTKGTKKRIGILLVAAIVMACSVMAGAYELTAGDLFKNHFTNSNVSSSKSSASASLTQSQVAEMDKAGVILDCSATDNGTVVNLRAAIGDKNCAYLLFDVIAPKGTVLDKNEYEFEDMPIDFYAGKDEQRPSKTDKTSGHSISWSVSTENDENPNDNVKSFVVRISCNGLDLQNRQISMKLKNLSVTKGKLTYTPVLKGEWKLDFKLDYDTSSKNITVNKATHFSNGCSATIQTVNLSSLSASIVFIDPSTPNNSKNSDDLRVPDLFLYLKDGTVLTVHPGPGRMSMERCIAVYRFNAPLNLDKVEKITIGDVDVPIE